VCTFKVKINFFHLLSAEKLIFRGAHKVSLFIKTASILTEA
jgi:hypothetical protein